MTGRPMFREAMGLVSTALVLRQMVLGLLVLLLSLAWLRVPDASWLEVCTSVVVALLVLALAGGCESALLLRLADEPRTAGKLLRGTLLLLVCAALWTGWLLLLHQLRWDDPLHAAYFNSRLPHAMRSLFSYESILLWLGWITLALVWIGAGTLAAFFIAAIPSRKPLRAAFLVLRSPGYWLTLMLGSAVSTFVTRLLLHWTPGHGLRLEMLSVALRLGLILVTDVVVVCMLLSILTVAARVSNSETITPAGIPPARKPLTAEIP